MSRGNRRSVRRQYTVSGRRVELERLDPRLLGGGDRERATDVRFEPEPPQDAADHRVTHAMFAAVARVLQCVWPCGIVSSVLMINAEPHLHEEALA